MANGSICGGIITESEFQKRLKDNEVEGVIMAFILPDDKYKTYWKLKDNGKDREATKIFDKFARSIT